MTTLAQFLNSEVGKSRPSYEWADLIGISRSHFSDITRGNVKPSLMLAARIRFHTGVSLDSYVTDEEVAPTPAPESVSSGDAGTPAAADAAPTAPGSGKPGPDDDASRGTGHLEEGCAA